VKKWQLLFLPGTRKKNFSIPIHVVNFCKTFCTCSPSTVVQGQGWQKNNSKNKNRNFEEIIFSKKSFFAW
jgi:hypothetical protein